MCCCLVPAMWVGAAAAGAAVRLVRPAPPRRTAKSCRNSQQLPGTATAEATRHTEEHSQLQQAASPGTMVSVEQLQVTTSTSHPQHLVSNVQCPAAVCRSSGRTIGSPVCKIGHTAKSWRVCCSAAAGRHSAARGHCGHVTTSLIPAIGDVFSPGNRDRKVAMDFALLVVQPLLFLYAGWV